MGLTRLAAAPRRPPDPDSLRASAVPTPHELRAQRAAVIGEARQLVERAEQEARDLSADERQQYDRAWQAQADLKAQIDAQESEAERRRQRQSQLAEAEAELSRTRGNPLLPERPGRGPAYEGGRSGGPGPYTFTLRRADPRAALNPRTGRRKRRKETITFQPGSAGHARHQADYRAAYKQFLRLGRASPLLHEAGVSPEAALQTDLGTQGGYFVAPEEFVAELLMDVDSMRWMRKLGRVFTTTAQSLGAVKRTSRMASFQWGAELTDAETVKDTALQFGKRSLTPHYMVGMVQVSRDLMRSAVLDPEEIVKYETGRDSGELEEKAYLAGTGAQQPLGIFTATPDGIDVSRDFSTGNTTTALGADNLRFVKYSLKPQYRANPSLRWLFHRDAVSQISRLKDGMGQYLWRDGISEADPDSILAIPVIESEFVPNTFTTGQYVGVLGAFEFYWIADSLEMDMLVLVEKYANTNQIGYIVRRKTDGMPQIAEAFARVKLA